MQNFYEVKFVEMSSADARKSKQLAFMVDSERFNILIGISGHGALSRGSDRTSCEGGWIYPLKGRIIWNSGLLSEVKDKFHVQNAIESAIGINFVER